MHIYTHTHIYTVSIKITKKQPIYTLIFILQFKCGKMTISYIVNNKYTRAIHFIKIK